MISNLTKTAVRLVGRTRITNKICMERVNSVCIQNRFGLMTHKNSYEFAKISKKDKDRQKEK